MGPGPVQQQLLSPLLCQEARGREGGKERRKRGRGQQEEGGGKMLKS